MSDSKILPSMVDQPAQTSLHIMLIEGEQQRMQPLDEALHAAGYPTRLIYNTDEALIYLSKIDVLLMPRTLPITTADR